MACKEKWWSNPCDSKNDIRYNPDISPDISNLNPILSKPAGLWKGTLNQYDGDLKEYAPGLAVVGLYPKGPKPYSSNADVFMNFTITGTRWEQHDIYVFPAAPQSFCDDNPVGIPGVLTNVADDGVCGVNGVAIVGDAFKTSTHEKNDVLIGVAGTGLYLVDQSRIEAVKSFSWTIIPSGKGQIVESAANGDIRSVFAYTLSNDFNSMLIEWSYYEVKEGTPPKLVLRQDINIEREEDESEWLKDIKESMVKFNVTDNTKETYGIVPTTGQCAKEDAGCPTLQNWCDKGDASPLCGSTPYVEETTVNASVVTGVAFAIGAVVIGAVVFLMLAYNKKKLAEVKEKIKNEFAKRIVATFSIGSGSEAITMEKITEEFKRIDSGESEGGDGMISKEEMKAFLVESSNVRDSILKNSVGGQMKDYDFETLFALIDEDGSGDVDFAEFSAFMGHIKENIDTQVENLRIKTYHNAEADNFHEP
jgi:Ca2+-binding EF-hand superfamily protein